MSDPSDKKPVKVTGVDSFLQHVARTPRRGQTADAKASLIFALDATASRQPTWDRAAELQAEMFKAGAASASLQIQLCHYRGMGEFHHSEWCRDSASLLDRMNRVGCLGGRTQIRRVLEHSLAVAPKPPLKAIVFIGDAVEEDIDALCDLAGQLGLKRRPLFLFIEGNDPHARNAFEQMARLSGGVCCPFDHGSADQLRQLLGAVAAYATGGRAALSHFVERHPGAITAPLRKLIGPPGRS